MDCTVTTAIPVSNLVMDTPVDFGNGNAEELARSIHRDGMIHRPVVRPIADRPDFYKVVAGRKRIHAAVELLGWTDVECDVRDVDDQAAESIELAENVFRAALSDEAKKKALIRWRAIYINEHANADGRRLRTTRPAAETDMLPSEVSAEMKAVSATERVSSSHEAPGTTASGPTPKPFARVLEKTLGISASAAKRLDRVARNLTVDHITDLVAQNVNNGQIDAIAALGNGDAIDYAVKQIGSGTNADEAVRQGKKLTPEKPATPKKAVNEGKAPKAPAPPKQKELTDEEWLATYCGTILSNLKHKTSFKNDAILYRRMSDATVRFRASVKKHVEMAKSPAGYNGAWFSNAYRIIKASHPTHWLVCGVCTGSGKNPENPNEPCTKCYGAAFKVRLED